MTYLCEKLKEYEKSGEVVHLQKMWSALSCDVITEYMFGFNYNQLGSKDFSNTFHQVFLDSGLFSNVVLQFPWIGQVSDIRPFLLKRN